jgi:hypothetical protein
LLGSNKGITKNIAEDGKIEGVGATGPITGKYM